MRFKQLCDLSTTILKLWQITRVAGILVNPNILKPFQYSVLSSTKTESIDISTNWQSNVAICHLKNNSLDKLNVRQITLLEGQLPYALDTKVYGEGFQMLAQYAGTIEDFRCIDRCDDSVVFRLNKKNDFQICYNFILFEHDDLSCTLIGFTSCFRFSGEFHLSPNGYLKVIVDTENREIRAGESWALESLCVLECDSRNEVLDAYGQLLKANHKVNKHPNVPKGWCSWYHFYERVSEKNIIDHCQIIKQRYPRLEYVQIDDGYQKHMGDWLTPSDKFPSPLPELINKIRKKNCKPGLWLAPFIAEENSEVFQKNPHWFVKSEEGLPLKAESVTYGGWRCTPWYVLDCTHPEVIAHVESLFKYLSQDLGIDYFKLDACFWGAIHGGHFYDKSKTRIEAYRAGLKALRKGAPDSHILGCNAPVWPSIGLVDSMRVTDDIERRDYRIHQNAKSYFLRSWQHSKLWHLDPDCLVFKNIPEQETDEKAFRFHHNLMFVASGILMLGDDLFALEQNDISKLKAIAQAPEFKVTHFNQETLIAEHKAKSLELFAIFNWSEQEKSITLTVPNGVSATDFWTKKPLTLSQKKQIVVAPLDSMLIQFQA